jgi:hypothetical protein
MASNAKLRQEAAASVICNPGSLLQAPKATAATLTTSA